MFYMSLDAERQRLEALTSGAFLRSREAAEVEVLGLNVEWTTASCQECKVVRLDQHLEEGHVPADTVRRSDDAVRAGEVGQRLGNAGVPRSGELHQPVRLNADRNIILRRRLDCR